MSTGDTPTYSLIGITGFICYRYFQGNRAGVIQGNVSRRFVSRSFM